MHSSSMKPRVARGDLSPVTLNVHRQLLDSVWRRAIGALSLLAVRYPQLVAAQVVGIHTNMPSFLDAALFDLSENSSVSRDQHAIRRGVLTHGRSQLQTYYVPALAQGNRHRAQMRAVRLREILAQPVRDQRRRTRADYRWVML
jgi:hypothetical protein